MSLLDNRLANEIAGGLPVLKKLRRFFLAFKDNVLPPKTTYSQSGEDAFVKELIPDITPSDYIYIEVGANQPTRLSNTYLFYRKGFRGIVIEPNSELAGLFKRFRPEDVHLEVGCSDSNGVEVFKFSDSSVMSGFSEEIKATYGKQKWVPMLTLDDIWRDAGKGKDLFMLSIDTEGYDLRVLRGAKDVLTRTLSLVIETSERDYSDATALLRQNGFRLAKTTPNNSIWINDNMRNNKG